MKEHIEEHIADDKIEFKPSQRSLRIGKSEAARQRRRNLKQVRETRTLNEWAKARRERKK